MAVLLAGCAAYEQIQRRRDQERFPRVGRAVDIGGRSLNMDCAGEGAPTVVLESDAMQPGYSWVGVQRELARFTRTCWYDRAGYGWSDPAAAPHTSRASVQDLHRLLGTAGIVPPYVLAGDGFGTLNVRIYCGSYREELAGVVLVDPIVPEDEKMGIAGRIPFHLGYPPGVVLDGLKGVGAMRLLVGHGRVRKDRVGLTEKERTTLAGLERLPSLKAAFLAEQGFRSALEEVRTAGTLGNVPLLVLRSATEEGAWQALGNRERDRVIRGSRRDILVEAPEAIVSAIRESWRPRSAVKLDHFKKPRHLGTQFARIESSLIVVLLPYNFSLSSSVPHILSLEE